MKMSQRRMARPSLGGLMATRQGALILAVLCAAVAAGILFFALGRYRSSLESTTHQATVLVATATIHRGTSGTAVASEALYKPMPITTTQLSPGAISDASLLTGKVASVDILPGQQLTLADFTGVSGTQAILAPNQRAVSINTDTAHGDLSVLAAGDRIDVYSLFNSLSTSGGKTEPTVLLLVPNVKVLKIASTTLVLAVNADQVPRVDWAASEGTLYLALRPPNGSASPITPTNMHSVVAASLQGGH